MSDKIHVLVVLQTHSKGDSQHNLGDKSVYKQRYCNAPKIEVTRRCTRSLVETINNAIQNPLSGNFEFELVVYDDHSDTEAISNIKENLSIAKFKTQFISLDTYGIMPSILKCYEHGRDYGKDVVYFAQDDYLYHPNAMFEMLEVLFLTKHNTGVYTCVFPYDDPFQYYTPANTMKMSHIIKTDYRHWRTQNATASCFMTFRPVIVKNWDLFYKMGTHEVNEFMEDESINQLFQRRGYFLMVPMPSVALHMQYDTEKDNLIDWKEWWNKYPRSDDSSLYQAGNQQ